MLADSLGNPVTLQDAASLVALNDFVEGVIACEARCVNIFQVADTDSSAIVQACCAALHLFAESHDAAASARPFLDRALSAMQANAGTTLRERRFVAAIEAWASGDTALACKLHGEQAQEFPRDLVSLKLGQYHHFNRGDAPAMLKLALVAHPLAADVPYLHGMTAFGYEQCHQLEDAEKSARLGIALCSHIGGKEPWAHHAIAHVMLTQGRVQEGHDFMRAMSPTWTGLNSFMVTHNWWHQALFEIELGQFKEALTLFDERVWGVVKTYSQDQINAVSLLSRLELCGVDVQHDGTQRWQDVAGFLTGRTADHVSPFLDLHYLYGLARAGRPEAEALLRNMEGHALACVAAWPAWQAVAVPAAHGLLAHAQGDWARATDKLASALPRLEAIGGSHAQRDWFVQLQADAAGRRH